MPDDLIQKLVTAFGSQPHSAMSRRDRIPIDIINNPKMHGLMAQNEVPTSNQVTGLFEPPTHPYDKGLITVSVPPNSPTKAITSVVNHELIHQMFNKANAYPTTKDYGMFGQINEPAGLNLPTAARPIPAPTSGPSNMWNWNLQGRAGDPNLEMPSYMGAYNQNQTPYTSPAARDQYMSDLFAYLKRNKHDDLVEKITKMMEGQKQGEKIY